MFAYVWTCNSFDYQKIVTDVKLHRKKRRERKPERTFSTIWYAVDDTVCIGTGIVCNLADKKPIWAEDIDWTEHRTARVKKRWKFALVCVTQLSVRTFWAHRLFFLSVVAIVQLFIMSVQCAYTFHLMVCCRYNSRRFVACECIYQNLYARKQELFTQKFGFRTKFLNDTHEFVQLRRNTENKCRKK